MRAAWIAGLLLVAGLGGCADGTGADSFDGSVAVDGGLDGAVAVDGGLGTDAGIGPCDPPEPGVYYTATLTLVEAEGSLCAGVIDVTDFDWTTWVPPSLPDPDDPTNPCSVSMESGIRDGTRGGGTSIHHARLTFSVQSSTDGADGLVDVWFSGSGSGADDGCSAKYKYTVRRSDGPEEHWYSGPNH